MVRNKHQEDSNPGLDPSSNAGSDPGSDPGFILSLSLRLCNGACKLTGYFERKKNIPFVKHHFRQAARRGAGVVVITLASHLRGPGSGHEWVKLFVGSLLCSESFLSAFSGSPLSSKINISKFQFDQMQDLPENHFRVRRASWVNISN